MRLDDIDWAILEHLQREGRMGFRELGRRVGLSAPAVTARVLRGAIEGLVASLNRNAKLEFVPADMAWAEVGARILVNGREIGQAGIFSDAIRQRLDLMDLTPCGAEVDFDELMALKAGPIKIQPIPRFPAIERDLSIVVAEETRWTDIVASVQRGAPASHVRKLGRAVLVSVTVPPGGRRRI